MHLTSVCYCLKVCNYILFMFSRYALICQQCFSHNGMALKEEFEYIGKSSFVVGSLVTGLCFITNIHHTSFWLRLST